MPSVSKSLAVRSARLLAVATTVLVVVAAVEAKKKLGKLKVFDLEKPDPEKCTDFVQEGDIAYILVSVCDLVQECGAGGATQALTT
jgi:hypothetical protein